MKALPGRLPYEKNRKWEPKLLLKGRRDNEAYDLRDLDGDGTPEVVVHCWVISEPLVVLKLDKESEGQPTGHCRRRQDRHLAANQRRCK